MNLILIRHGVSEQRENWQNNSPLSDNFRPLTKMGLVHFSKASSGLTQMIAHVDFIYSSQLTRALQTAEILHGRYPNSKLITNKHLNPTGNPKSVLSLLQRHIKSDDNLKTIAYVGHNPDIGYLANYLLKIDKKNCIISFKKGSCAFFDYSPTKSKLLWHMTQDQLAALRH